ncbi:MAG: AAA family ATPase [Janthinobacterium lividum]
MHINRIRIQNIRSIENALWDGGLESAGGAGWHVILGDNGSGKSSFIRAVALALVGPSEAKALRQDWNEWLRKDQQQGSVRLILSGDGKYDSFSGQGSTPSQHFLSAGVILMRREDSPVALVKMKTRSNPDRFIWADKGGWFCASYGPFRRFTGGDKDFEKVFYSNPKLAAHLSAFGESVALTESIQWLQDLKFRELEADNSPEARFLLRLTHFINQNGFLPHHTHLANVSSKGVMFVDGNGCDIAIEELSDGYRSILSMTLELIRQMGKTYPNQNIFSSDCTKVIVPGVVLIDEVDAHLHPSWQRQIGLWFREHFPYIQFIVTTHSPFVCQAADVGTVYRLPKPGSNEKAGMVTGVDLDRLLFGNVLDAYSTDMFGTGATRSEESKKRLQRLAELNMAELMRDLTEAERTEMESLRSTLPTAAHSLPAVTNGVK